MAWPSRGTKDLVADATAAQDQEAVSIGPREYVDRKHVAAAVAAVHEGASLILAKDA